MTAAPTRTLPAFLDRLAEDVLAYIQPDGGWCVSNAGLVTGGGRAVLIDTAATQPRAARLRDAVTGVVPGGPDLVINTHHHGDHVFGNSLFAPSATVLAHELARVEMIEAGLGLQQLFPQADWGAVALEPPTVTFRGRAAVHVGDLRLELLPVGPAHTTGDVAVWIPDRKVLFAGDVVMAGATPFCLMGSVEGSRQAVRRLRDLGAETVVTGHGPVAGPEVFDTAESYLSWVASVAAGGIREGLAPLDAARRADLGEFAGLLDSERLVGNLHRAYAELRGTPPGAPIDLLSPMREMVEFNGGPLTCHA
jgi:cyclase